MIAKGQEGTLRITGALSLANPSKKTLHLTVQAQVDAKPVGPAEAATLAGRSALTVPIAAWAAGLAAGDHKISVKVNGDGIVDLNGGTLQEVGLPPGSSAQLPNAFKTFDPPAPIRVSSTKFSSVVGVSLTTSAVDNIAVDGLIGLLNTARTSSTVHLRYLLDGKVTGAAIWLSIAPNTRVVDPFSLLCDSIPAGAHVLSVQLLSSAPGTKVVYASLGGVGIPATTLQAVSPIPTAASYGQPASTSAGSFQNIADTKIDTSGASALGDFVDLEMTSWVTLENPSAHPATVVMRGTTDGVAASDDPQFTVTVPPHVQLTIVGPDLVCDSLSLGPHDLGLQLKSSIAGVEVQVSTSRLTAWASPTTP
jgi:hypothetical protein